MATLNRLFDSQEQICYVQCSFCTTILLVSVPYTSMSMVVTVRCGHCTGLLSVNMLKASFVPFHLFSSLNQDEINKHQEEVDTSKVNMDRQSTTLSMQPSSEEDNDYVNDDEYDEDDEDIIAIEHIVHKPPEKKRRAPSAYNRFIKEEIKRLKAKNPNMCHKEAFSTAAKNWAHFPSVHYEVDEGDGSSNGIAQNLEGEAH